jgi:hypothetical protein
MNALMRRQHLAAVLADCMGSVGQFANLFQRFTLAVSHCAYRVTVS